MNYYKISPEVASRLDVKTTAVRHPDGWYLILQPVAARLARMLLQDEGLHLSAEEAVRHVGGVVYTHAEALCSQRGEPEYMMNTPKQDAQQLSESQEATNKDNDNNTPQEGQE